MTKRQFLLEKRNKKIAALYREGKSLDESGAPFGLKREMVRRIIIRQGMRLRPRWPNAKPKLTREEKQKIKQIKFWSQAALTSDSTKCWEWQGNISVKGYGRTGWNGKITYARRVAWQIHNSKAPANSILNSCNNSLCVNPNHLIEGPGKKKNKCRSK